MFFRKIKTKNFLMCDKLDKVVHLLYCFTPKDHVTKNEQQFISVIKNVNFSAELVERVTTVHLTKYVCTVNISTIVSSLQILIFKQKLRKILIMPPNLKLLREIIFFYIYLTHSDTQRTIKFIGKKKQIQKLCFQLDCVYIKFKLTFSICV